MHNSLNRCSPSVLEVLSSYSRELTSYDAEVGWPDESRTGTLEGPNQGWIWAGIHDLSAGEKPLLQRYVLRRMGYVFWDAARLRDDWRLPSTSPSMLKLTPRSYDDNDRDWGTDKGSSIEERFKDIAFPKGALDNRDERVCALLSPSSEWEEQIKDGYPTPFSDREAELFGIEY